MKETPGGIRVPFLEKIIKEEGLLIVVTIGPSLHIPFHPFFARPLQILLFLESQLKSGSMIYS